MGIQALYLSMVCFSLVAWVPSHPPAASDANATATATHKFVATSTTGTN
eukprot:CAMPEP_0184506762 /NCGR_PEP_ID=MMETSP0113_2-20130426/53667_1 /TAXON_ID=91329 /ORGANISM="Norrisiella sphaerica, Strain BC52" /LENGTH=48 /DNA_ID= /DNA_START= /DNA_END= /DNA_ORIENTATION=